jgi:hypothetical protein
MCTSFIASSGESVLRSYVPVLEFVTSWKTAGEKTGMQAKSRKSTETGMYCIGYDSCSARSARAMFLLQSVCAELLALGMCACVFESLNPNGYSKPGKA